MSPERFVKEESERSNQSLSWVTLLLLLQFAKRFVAQVAQLTKTRALLDRTIPGARPYRCADLERKNR